MKKTILRLVAILLSLLLLLGVVLGLGLLTPSQYHETFLGALAPKYQRLYDTEEPKIILIGGSSVAFGYDTEWLGEQLGMPVINFGLYATLGTRVMMDLARDSIEAGDIIVLAPEPDPQTLSLYFGGEAMWQAADSDLSMLAHIDYDNWGSMVGAYWQFAAAKWQFALTEPPRAEGVYSRQAFDEFGDISYERPYNIMTLGYDPGKSVSLSPEILAPEFAEYVNEYTEMAEARGATVYFTLAPINRLALTEDTTEDSLWAFYDHLSRTLRCEVITDLRDCIMEPGYFYDSNFHLNDSGVVVRSATLLGDLRRAMGNTTPVEVELPPVPEKPTDPPTAPEFDPNDTQASLDAPCFTYAEYGDGWVVTGVTDQGQERTELTVPVYYEGKLVLSVGEYTFRDCTQLKKVTIGPNITHIYSKAFADCVTLTTVRLDTQGDKILVNNETLLEETSQGLRFSTSRENYSTFAGDYFWAPYASRFTVE